MSHKLDFFLAPRLTSLLENLRDRTETNRDVERRVAENASERRKTFFFPTPALLAVLFCLFVSVLPFVDFRAKERLLAVCITSVSLSENLKIHQTKTYSLVNSLN